MKITPLTLVLRAMTANQLTATRDQLLRHQATIKAQHPFVTRNEKACPKNIVAEFKATNEALDSIYREWDVRIGSR